jgi:hypothetical protein
MLKILTSPHYPAEKEYVFQVLFNELLGIDFEIIHQTDIAHYALHLPNGSILHIEDHFFGKHQGLEYLKTENIPENAVLLPHPFEPGETIAGVYGRSHYSTENQTITLGIDVLASAFFMLTRWEEYVKPDRDQYGRFPAAASWAFRNDLLDRPIVNEYAELLWRILVQLGWNEPRKPKNFWLHLSHDVDHPLLWWSATDRLRTLAGSIFQRKNTRETAWWLQHHIFKTRDPYDIFEDWMDFSEQNGLVSHFNFLGKRPPGFDCYYDPEHPFVRNLIKRIAGRGHVVGFHPSREAFTDPVVFERELASLRQISPVPVLSGRQHYLCFAAPHTWQRWADAGMAWDSTLGYPEAEGFRCGICCAFPVFHFLTRQTLPLREKPLTAMDVTLVQYRRYTPEQGFDRLQHLRRQTEKYGGEFVLLWHNSSWNTYAWAPWQEVYRAFVKLG